MKALFNQIVGIDQTGAIDSKGRFRPLYGVTLSLDADGAVLSHVAEHLPRLDFNRWRMTSDRTLILVDAVLGLPESMWRPNESIRDLFALTRDLTQFGIKGGEEFFLKLYADRTGHKLLDKVSADELRESERVHNAQSLFRSKPYQRNVQTGTLRVWHELSQQNLGDVAIWPHDPVRANHKLVLAEGYPVIFKDHVLPALPDFDNPNFRDAGRLAWGARELMLTQKNFLHDLSSREGAIFSIHSG